MQWQIPRSEIDFNNIPPCLELPAKAATKQDSVANYHKHHMYDGPGVELSSTLPVSLQESPQHSHPLHPEVFLTGPGVSCSLPLTEPTVTTFPPGLVVGSHAGPGVDSHGLLDHETVLDQLPDVGAGVGVGDLVDLVGIQPHLGINNSASPN